MTPINKKVRVKVIREKKLTELSVNIGKLSADKTSKLKVNKDSDFSVYIERLAINVLDLTEKDRKKNSGIKQGVLVQEVKSGPARDAGIQSGDLILRVQNKDIGSAQDLDRVVKSLPPKKSVAVLVQRGGSPVFLAIRIEK